MRKPLSKTLHGYTAQARYYAEHLATYDGDGDWQQLGWARLENGRVKPVYRHQTTGVPVAICDGRSHLDVIISEIDPAMVRETEDECYQFKGE